MTAPLEKLLSANSTGNSAPALTISGTKPATSATLGLYTVPGGSQYVRIIPFAVASDNVAVTLYVYRYFANSSNATGAAWQPVLQGVYTCTTCAITGAADQPVVVAERYCDTIAQTSGDANFDTSSNASDQIAELRIDPLGAVAMAFVFVKGSATSCNALIGAY